MKRISVSTAATADRTESKRRRRNNTKTVEPAVTTQLPQQHKQREFQEADSLEQQTRDYHIVTARLPTSVLQPRWTLGKNRQLDEQHAQNLCNIFKSGSLDRKSKENYLRVLCSTVHTDKMLEYLRHQGSSNENGVQSFAEWATVNPNVHVELMSGQHRVRALDLYIQQTGASEDEAWWTCDFYDKGF